MIGSFFRSAKRRLVKAGSICPSRRWHQSYNVIFKYSRCVMWSIQSDITERWARRKISSISKWAQSLKALLNSSHLDWHVRSASVQLWMSFWQMTRHDHTINASTWKLSHEERKDERRQNDKWSSYHDHRKTLHLSWIYISFHSKHIKDDDDGNWRIVVMLYDHDKISKQIKQHSLYSKNDHLLLCIREQGIRIVSHTLCHDRHLIVPLCHHAFCGGLLQMLIVPLKLFGTAVKRVPDM